MKADLPRWGNERRFHVVDRTREKKRERKRPTLKCTVAICALCAVRVLFCLRMDVVLCKDHQVHQEIETAPGVCSTDSFLDLDGRTWLETTDEVFARLRVRRATIWYDEYERLVCGCSEEGSGEEVGAG